MPRLLLSMATLILFLMPSPTAAPASDVTGDAAPEAVPHYTGKTQLLPPQNYREWIYLSSGFDMNYSPVAMGHHMFSNVFVPQWAYQQFLKSGKWPEKTMFVVEERGSESRGSINKQGSYQADLMGIGVEVKDSATFPETWAYFNFDEDTKSAAPNPKAACFQCHEDHAAVEHSFVQFYPTLKPVAKKFGTYKQSAENVDSSK